MPCPCVVCLDVAGATKACDQNLILLTVKLFMPFGDQVAQFPR